MKLHHHPEQLELGASPNLHVNKVALSGFKLLASGYNKVLLSAMGYQFAISRLNTCVCRR